MLTQYLRFVGCSCPFVGVLFCFVMYNNTSAHVLTVPLWRDEFSWMWAFAFLAIGPAVGVVAMVSLHFLPESEKIANGKR